MPDFRMVGEDRGDDVGEEGVPLIGGEGELPSQDVGKEDDAVGTVAQVGDPLFGLHVGQRMRLSTFAGYGLVLCTCKDFRAAAAQTLRFEGLAPGSAVLRELDAVEVERYMHAMMLAAVEESPTAAGTLVIGTDCPVLGVAHLREAARLLALHKVRRDMVDADVAINAGTASLDLGQEARLKTSRMGYGAGRDFRVIGISTDGRKQKLTAQLWG